MEDTDGIDGWNHREPKSSDNLTEDGEVWRKTDEPNEEITIDRSDRDEPRDWWVVFPDGRRRFSRSRPVVMALAELYMRTGSL